MQTYDISIAPNVTRQLDAPGSYFYYYAGSAGGADSTITLRGISSGLRLILKPGQAFRLPSGDVETSWVLTNYANVATIIGTVLVGDGEITDNRVTGSVEVIDGGKNRTNSDTAFMFYGESTGAAGQNAHLQLWNPSNTGKNAIVTKMRFTPSVSSYLKIARSTAALTTFQLNPTSKKLNGSAVVSAMESRAQSGSGLFSSYIAYFGTLGLETTVLEFSEPIIVAPGNGLVSIMGTVAATLDVTYEYFEESIV